MGLALKTSSESGAIADRTFIARDDVRGQSVSVTIALGPAVKYGPMKYGCDYSITADGQKIKSFRSFGVDGVQALLLAVTMLVTDANAFLRANDLSFNEKDLEELRVVRAAFRSLE